MRSRYPTRRSSVAPMFFPISPPQSITPSPVLRPALRVLRPTAGDPDCVEAVKPSSSTGSPVTPAPLLQHKTDMDGLCATNTSLVEVPQQDLDGHFQPLMEMSVVPHVLMESKTHDFPSSNWCLNSKKFAIGHEDEEECAPCVHSHKVKAEIAPLVDKYRDIASESNVKSSQLGGDGHFQPQGVMPHVEHMLEKCKTYDGPSTNRCLSSSHSLNLTEFAKRLEDDDDDDEVESAPCVRGHKVKPEIAPLVGAIFDKHGDITAESNVKSPSIVVSLFLERLCCLYQRLEQRKFADITHAEINDMLDELYHYENQKFNVRWLLEKLERIYEANKSAEKYLLVKGEAAKCMEANERIEEEIEMNERHVALIQKKISAAKEKKESNEAKAKEYTKMAMDIRAGIKALATQSLVHGLL